jgi:hypothetical protein
MVENNSNSEAKPQPESNELQFVESINKEEEEKLAAFLGKVTAGLAEGEGGNVPDSINATLNDWMNQLNTGSFTVGTQEQPNGGEPKTEE